jgi:hypothetical protein
MNRTDRNRTKSASYAVAVVILNRAFLVATPFALAALAACGPGDSAGSQPPGGTITSHIPVPASAATAPPIAPPATVANCPYLGTLFVEDANGQHVGRVRISATDGGQTDPTCYFYRPDGGLQLTVRVYTGDQATATAVVNQAAPVTTSDPASDPSGWTGGSQATATGAVYAVSKGGDAVVVITNQKQTIKARRVAVQAITGLGM